MDCRFRLTGLPRSWFGKRLKYERYQVSQYGALRAQSWDLFIGN